MASHFSFDCFDVDVAAGRLSRRGVRIRLPEKSFQVLAALVEQAGQVVTREDLQRRLWADDVFVDFENNLNTAIGRLREALGDSASHPRFIETLPKRGYRFIATLADARTPPRTMTASARRRWRPAAAADVPGAPWVLEEKLGEGGFGEVWLARHRRLKEPRVLKFCLREDRVRALKREMTLFRVWRAKVGDHPHLVQILGVNLDRPPFYLEEEYVSGRDLRTWCAAQGGIGQVPVPLRLELLAQAADGLAAAHEAGIVHRDIKPGNILVSSPAAGRGPIAKLTDFGIGRVVSEEALAGITVTGRTSALGLHASGPLMGTHAYLAPELLMGRPATVQSDLYSMGVVLFQLLVQDFGQPVTTDWARAIPDAVEREDLQRCFAGRPEERFASAADLAGHLRSMSARRDARAAAAKSKFERGGAKIASLAVLPFANLSADSEDEFLSDGMADDLLMVLSRVPGLRVPGRTSCFAFKGKNEDLRWIGQALGVETVLEGSLRRAGTQLRITVQLINVADGFHLWSDRYDREIADMFAVQDEITHAIVAALIPKLAAEPPKTVVRPYTGSIEAYELCLRARYHHQKRTPEGFGLALRLFEQAEARDPECPLVHAGLAHTHLLMSYFGGVPASVGLPKSKASARRAVALDDDLAIAHVRLADALTFWDWDWAGAEREFLRAIEIDPDNSEALSRYGLFLWARQRNPEALVQMRKAVELDPFSLDTNWLLGWACASARLIAEGEELARKMIAMDANLWTGYHIRGVVKAVKGHWPEAIRDMQRAAAIEGGALLGPVCAMCAHVGRMEEARQAIERLEELIPRRYVPPAWLALGYAGLGDEARARPYLQRAFEEHDLLLVHLRGLMAWFGEAGPGWLAGLGHLLDERGL